MTSQTGQQIVTIHILLNKSRSKVNRTIKLGQLIGYNMRNAFFEVSYTKFGGETSPRSFHKRLKFIVSLAQQCEML